ncbi:MAG TPA: hypothetical protein VJ851_08805 [Jatrophihabitans sp.]|nr:hypothetical protein [Jatrophihabitans sp.]
MSIATDVRSYADTALAQGKAALSNAGTAAVLVNKRLITDAPKPALAVLGAADLVASLVTRRVEALPAEAADGVSKVQNRAGAYLSTAKDLYSKLTVRGEAKAAELRNSRLFGQLGQLADSVESTVSPVVKSAFDTVESVSPVETKPVAKPAAARSTRKAATAKTSTAGTK